MSVNGGLPDYAVSGSAGSAGAPANLGDILERVLDKGLVVAGDIRVNLLDIELLTVKLRLVVASLETAREVGIDWWERDPWLQGREDEHDRERELESENRRLRRRVAALEADDRRELESGSADELDDMDELDEDEDEQPERRGRRR